MIPATRTYRSRFATAVFGLLNPIPYGLFVGTLIFDFAYAATANVFWGRGAAWLVTTALLFAIISSRDQSLSRMLFSERNGGRR